MHRDEPRDRQGQVIAEGLLGDLERQGLAVASGERVVLGLAEEVPVVEQLENELVSFFSVLPGQGGQRLHRWRLDRHEAPRLERRPKRREDPLTAGHDGRREIAGSLGDARLAHRGQS